LAYLGVGGEDARDDLRVDINALLNLDRARRADIALDFQRLPDDEFQRMPTRRLRSLRRSALTSVVFWTHVVLLATGMKKDGKKFE
jgi:hypothetical protein